MQDEEQSTLSATQHDRKGKRRASSTVHESPTERTPLLGQLAGTSQIPWEVVDETEEARHQSSRRRLCAKLTRVFLISLSITILALVAIALLAWSYASRASGLTPQDIINKHLTLKGPDKVKVLNITHDGGIWVEVRGMLGVDVGDAMGINPSSTDGFFEGLWKSIGRQGVRSLGSVSLNLSTVSVLPEFDPYEGTLANLELPPLEVPLSVDPPSDGSWLTPMTVVSLVYPTTNATVIAAFLKDAWKRGYFAVRADVDNVYVRGGLWTEPSWRTKFHGKLSHIQTSLRMQVPLVPGLPRPGANVPLPNVSDLVTLKSFNIHSASSTLKLEAEATLVDPAPPNFSFTSPPLDFTISLPYTPPSNRTNTSSSSSDGDEDEVRAIDIARVTASPFTLTHPNITLHLTGTVLPIHPTSLPTLSAFLKRYLSGLPNPILISLTPPSDTPGPGSQNPPWLPTDLRVPAMFPAPNPRPHLLQNVTIRDMKLKPPPPKGGEFLASGVVEGYLVLPRGMHVGLDVSRLLPDVLVFDGEVPGGNGSSDLVSSVGEESGWGWWDRHGHPGSGSGGGNGGKSKNKHPPPRDPLPSPLPEHAFGHIRPEGWVVAKSVRVDLDPDGEGKEETGAVYAVTARVVDVPLEVLPGRQKEFSNFVSKVIFNPDGALAGIQGTAAVGLTVDGLPTVGKSHPAASSNYLVLAGLPFQGSVRINKKSLLNEEEGLKGLRKIVEGFPFIQR